MTSPSSAISSSRNTSPSPPSLPIPAFGPRSTRGPGPPWPAWPPSPPPLTTTRKRWKRPRKRRKQRWSRRRLQQRRYRRPADAPPQYVVPSRHGPHAWHERRRRRHAGVPLRQRRGNGGARLDAGCTGRRDAGRAGQHDERRGAPRDHGERRCWGRRCQWCRRFAWLDGRHRRRRGAYRAWASTGASACPWSRPYPRTKSADAACPGAPRPYTRPVHVGVGVVRTLGGRETGGNGGLGCR